jgi:hypothetical protein
MTDTDWSMHRDPFDSSPEEIRAADFRRESLVERLRLLEGRYTAALTAKMASDSAMTAVVVEMWQLLDALRDELAVDDD